MRGLEAREKAETRRIAWAIAWVVNSSGNLPKPVSVAEILGECETNQAKPESPTKGMNLKERHEYIKALFKKG